MSRKNNIYTEEFKTEAVHLALSAVSVSQTAKSLGIPEATLHGWVARARKSGEQVITNAEGLVNHVNVTQVLEENKRLKQQLARLEQEKAILKKAATYFAKELG